MVHIILMCEEQSIFPLIFHDSVSFLVATYPDTYNVANDASALSKIHKRNLDDKEVSASLKFQTSSENFYSGKGNDSNRVSICIWHYNH